MRPTPWLFPLALALAAPLHAQDKPAPAPDTQPAAKAEQPADNPNIDAAANDLITKSRAAIRNVTDFSADVDQRNTDPDKTETFKGSVHLTLERDTTSGAGTIKNFRVSSAAGGAGGQTWAFDGHTATMIDTAKKTWATVDANEPARVMPVADAFNTIPAWVLRDTLMSPTAKITAAKMLPSAMMDGVKVLAVEYTVVLPMPYSKQDGEDEIPNLVLRQIRHIGADDLMPRKLESWVTYTGKVPDTARPRTYSGTFTHVKTNTHPDSDAFVLEQPDGFEKVKRPYPPDLGVPSDDLRFVVGDRAPDFALKDPDGKEVTLASLKGRVVLLDFWATWCGPCKMAMPHVQAVHEKYSGKAVSVFGVDTWERAGPEAPRKYMQEQKFSYGLLMKGDDLAKTYGITGIPTFVVIGADGTILHTHIGFEQDGETKLSAIIDKALEGKQ